MNHDNDAQSWCICGKIKGIFDLTADMSYATQFEKSGTKHEQKRVA